MLLERNMGLFTAIIKKGEKQFVALCPELDVVRQGHAIEEALVNLKEAVELHIEETGISEKPKDTFIVNFEVQTNDKATQIVR